MNWNSIGADSLWGIDGEDLAYQSIHDALYYGKNYAGPTFKSLDRGITWQKTGPPDTLVGLCTIAVTQDDPPILLAGSEKGVIARSSNEGSVWQETFPADTESGKSAEVPKAVFSWYARNALGEKHFALVTRWLSNGRGIVATNDAGLTWSVLPFYHNTAWALDIDQRSSKLSGLTNQYPTRFWIGLFRDRSDTVHNGMVQETTDGGNSWHSTNFPRGDSLDVTNPLVSDVWMIKFDTLSQRLVAATGSGIYSADFTEGVAEEAPENLAVNLEYADNRLKVSSEGAEMRSIAVYDLLGRVILYVSGLHSNVWSGSLSEAPSGLLEAVVTSASGSQLATKFLRQ